MSLPAGLANGRARNPQKIAVAFGEQSWTYAEFDDLTNNVAANLLADGLRPGERIALHLLNGPEFAVACFGCLKAGCVAVPLNTRLKGGEIDYLLRHSGASSYIGQPDLYSETAATCPAFDAISLQYLSGESNSPHVRRFQDLLRSPMTRTPLPEIAPDALAAILYTSGTTAHPKGVMHSHPTLMETALAMHSTHLDADQVVLITSSMSHMVGFAMLFLSALLNGATAVITRPFEFHDALAAHERWRVTYALSLPVIFQKLLLAQAAEHRDVSSGRFYFCGGDCVSPALQRSFGSAFAPLCELYGSTEVAPASWNRPGQVRVGSIGTPGPGVRFRLLDSAGCDVKAGDVGEICVQATHLMTGYWSDPGATAAAIREGWFHTGDLARCDAEGYYCFAGRKKEIIIRGGSNISPQEVEAALYENPAVAEAAVVGRPDAVWGEIVVAHVVIRDRHDVTERDLIAFAKERIADYKTPEAVIFHSELPKSATGKIQRRALREMQCPAETSSQA